MIFEAANGPRELFYTIFGNKRKIVLDEIVIDCYNMRMKKQKTKPRNFVAKYARHVNRAAVHRDRKKYYRKNRNWKKDVDK